MPPYRAILFDLDGVLIFSREVWFHLLNATAGAFGVGPVSREAFGEIWGQGIQADVDRFFPHCSVARIETYYNEHFLDFAQHIKVEQDAAKVFPALAAAGLRSAVVTNTPAPATRSILAHVALRPDVLVGGTDTPRPKPAPDMLLLAMEKLGVKPEEALMVGDTSYDRDAARAAGVSFAGYGIKGDATLTRLADLLDLLGIGG